MRKSINEQIEVMKAFAEGKAVEYRNYKGCVWTRTLDPSWNWRNRDYRVALKPLPEIGEVLMLGKSAEISCTTVVIVWAVDEVNRTFATYNQLDCYGVPITIYKHKADDKFTVLAHIGN